MNLKKILMVKYQESQVFEISKMNLHCLDGVPISHHIVPFATPAWCHTDCQLLIWARCRSNENFI